MPSLRDALTRGQIRCLLTPCAPTGLPEGVSAVRFCDDHQARSAAAGWQRVGGGPGAAVLTAAGQLELPVQLPPPDPQDIEAVAFALSLCQRPIALFSQPPGPALQALQDAYALPCFLLASARGGGKTFLHGRDVAVAQADVVLLFGVDPAHVAPLLSPGALTVHVDPSPSLEADIPITGSSEVATTQLAALSQRRDDGWVLQVTALHDAGAERAPPSPLIAALPPAVTLVALDTAAIAGWTGRLLLADGCDAAGLAAGAALARPQSAVVVLWGDRPDAGRAGQALMTRLGLPVVGLVGDEVHPQALEQALASL